MKWFIPVLAVVLSFPVSGFAEEYEVAGTPVLKSPAVIPAMSGDMEKLGDRVRVAFYNIENFGDGENDGKTRSPELAASQAKLAAEILDEIDADILMVCEIENTTSARLLNDALKRPFPKGWVTVFNMGGGGRLNMAAFSRFGPVECAEIDFSTMMGPGKPPRGAMRLNLDLGEKHSLLLYMVHLKSNYGKARRNSAKRESAMKVVRDNADQMLESNPDRKWEVLVLGDMNVDPSQKQFKNDTSMNPVASYDDLWIQNPAGQEVTLPYRKASPFYYEPATFDRFYASPALASSPWTAGFPSVIQKGVNVTGKTTSPGEDGHVSDHYPVYVDLER